MPFLDFLLKKIKKPEEKKQVLNPIIRENADPLIKWEELKAIGDGAFGQVYQVRDKEKGTFAAMKRIKRESDEDLEDALVEVDILSACLHRNIISIYDAYLTKDFLWIMIEFCDGGALDSIMLDLERSLNENQIRYICHEIVDGLAFLHKNLIIHRDLKAGNILVKLDGQVKLADFGVSAKNKDERHKRETYIGSPYWMAPEVIYCETYKDEPYDYKADVWSLGITLIELAQMNPPNHEMNPGRAVMKIYKSDPPKLDKPSLWSQKFHKFLESCLVKSPASRATMEQLQGHEFIVDVTDETDRKYLRELISEAKAEILDILTDVDHKLISPDLLDSESLSLVDSEKLLDDNSSLMLASVDSLQVDEMLSSSTGDDSAMNHEVKDSPEKSDHPIEIKQNEEDDEPETEPIPVVTVIVEDLSDDTHLNEHQEKNDFVLEDPHQEKSPEVQTTLPLDEKGDGTMKEEKPEQDTTRSSQLDDLLPHVEAFVTDIIQQALHNPAVLAKYGIEIQPQSTPNEDVSTDPPATESSLETNSEVNENPTSDPNNSTAIHSVSLNRRNSYQRAREEEEQIHQEEDSQLNHKTVIPEERDSNQTEDISSPVDSTPENERPKRPADLQRKTSRFRTLTRTRKFTVDGKEVVTQTTKLIDENQEAKKQEKMEQRRQEILEMRAVAKSEKRDYEQFRQKCQTQLSQLYAKAKTDEYALQRHYEQNKEFLNKTHRIRREKCKSEFDNATRNIQKNCKENHDKEMRTCQKRQREERERCQKEWSSLSREEKTTRLDKLKQQQLEAQQELKKSQQEHQNAELNALKTHYESEVEAMEWTFLKEHQQLRRDLESKRDAHEEESLEIRQKLLMEHAKDRFQMLRRHMTARFEKEMERMQIEFSQERQQLTAKQTKLRKTQRPELDNMYRVRREMYRKTMELPEFANLTPEQIKEKLVEFDNKERDRRRIEGQDLEKRQQRQFDHLTQKQALRVRETEQLQTEKKQALLAKETLEFQEIKRLFNLEKETLAEQLRLKNGEFESELEKEVPHFESDESIFRLSTFRDFRASFSGSFKFNTSSSSRQNSSSLSSPSEGNVSKLPE